VFEAELQFRPETCSGTATDTLLISVPRTQIPCEWDGASQ
jgi:hypothetical protein